MSDTEDTVVALKTAAEKEAAAKQERKALLKQRIVGGSSLALTFLVLCALILIWPSSDPSNEVSVKKTYAEFKAEARAEVEKEINDKAVAEGLAKIEDRIAKLEKSGNQVPPVSVSGAQGSDAEETTTNTSDTMDEQPVADGANPSGVPQSMETPQTEATPPKTGKSQNASNTSTTPQTENSSTLGKEEVKNEESESKDSSLFKTLKSIQFETRLLLIVLLSGALGSLVHTLTSFARHMGVGDYSERWTWWYVLRVPIGMALALIMYFSLRGGFFVPTTTGQVTAKQIVNPFGFATVAALAGMFSKQAVDKLKELFDVIFKVKKPPTPAIPHIVRVAPTILSVAQKNASLTLVGTDFREDTIVQINGVARETSFLNSQALTLIPAKEDIAKAGSLEIYAINTGKLGGTSETVTVNVKKAAPA